MTVSQQRTPWTDDDQEWARVIGEYLDMGPGEQVEHFVVGASVGSGQVDGLPRKVFVVACCRNCGQPTHLMNHVMELLAGRN